MKNPWMGYLCAAFATAAWGSIYVVSKFVMEHVPVFTLLFLRYGIAAAFLAIVLRGRKWAPIERSDYKHVFLIGFVGYFMSVAAQFVGTQLSGASLASVINSMAPVFIVMFAVPILKERLTFSKITALAASLLGANFLMGTGGDQGAIGAGVAVSFFAVLSWSWMSVAVKRISGKYDAISLTVYAMVVAAVCTLPASLYELLTVPNVELFDPVVALSVIYMAIVATAVAHVCWNKSLSMLEASTCSLFYPVQPLVSVLLGALLLGERMQGRFWVGMGLIAGGVLVSVLAGQPGLARQVRRDVTAP